MSDISYSGKNLYRRGRMKQMIDLHCHILPGIDDGAQTITDSLTMAQQAFQKEYIQLSQRRTIKMANI